MHPLSARSCAGLISPEASAVVIATGLATLASPDFAEGLRLAVDTPSEIAASLCLSIVLASAWLCWVGLLRWYSMLGFFAGVCLCAAVMLAASPEAAAAAAPFKARVVSLADGNGAVGTGGNICRTGQT